MSIDTLSLYELIPGKILSGRYKVVRSARHNGFMAAFDVLDTQGESAELLFFAAGLFEGPEQARTFASSFESWKRVNTPAAVRVREILGQGHGNLLVITDPPPAENLRVQLKLHTRLPADEVLRLGRQLAAGLVEIHAHGLVHGDIKPDTIGLHGLESKIEKLEQAVLVDGGITPGLWHAKHLGERTALIGTPFYAPVEQFGGDAPDVQSDIYNLATVMFECVAGVLPWPGKHFLEIFQAKLDKRPPLVSHRAPKVELDENLEAAIARGLMADRSQRFGTAQELLSALEAVGG